MTWALNASGHLQDKASEEALVDALRAVLAKYGTQSSLFGGTFVGRVENLQAVVTVPVPATIAGPKAAPASVKATAAAGAAKAPRSKPARSGACPATGPAPSFPEREETTVGVRGPVPKRADQRRRGNTDGGPITKGTAAATRGVPAASKEWHPAAKRWYAALKASGESAFYEPSDWAEAWVVAEVLSQMLQAEKLSAMLFAAWQGASARLLVTEGDRRRVRIELERGGQTDPDARRA